MSRAALLMAGCLVAAGVLAGCLDAEPADVTSTEAHGQPPPAPATGAVSGVVTDTALNPIGGAVVRILDAPRNTTSRADGSFRIADVHDGVHVVRAEARGFFGRSLQAEVANGSEVALEFRLDRVPVAEPYAEAVELQGFIACQLSVVTGGGHGGGGEEQGVECGSTDANDRRAHEVAIGREAKMVVLELLWEATSDGSKVLALHVGAVADEPQPVGDAEGEGYSRIEVGPSVLEALLPFGGTITTEVGVGGSLTDEEADVNGGVALQQPFTLIVTTFYREAGPPGYTAVTR